MVASFHGEVSMTVRGCVSLQETKKAAVVDTKVSVVSCEMPVLSGKCAKTQTTNWQSSGRSKRRGKQKRLVGEEPAVHATARPKNRLSTKTGAQRKEREVAAKRRNRKVDCWLEYQFLMLRRVCTFSPRP